MSCTRCVLFGEFERLPRLRFTADASSKPAGCCHVPSFQQDLPLFDFAVCVEFQKLKVLSCAVCRSAKSCLHINAFSTCQQGWNAQIGSSSVCSSILGAFWAHTSLLHVERANSHRNHHCLWPLHFACRKESAVTGMRCVGVAVLVTAIVSGRSYVFRVSHLGEKSPRHTLQKQNPPSS